MSELARDHARGRMRVYPSVMAEDALLRDPFESRLTADGRVLISRGGRIVTTVAGQHAERLRARLERATTAAAQQQVLARATGNYRR